LIREGKTFQIPSIMQTSKQLGMVTLNDALLDLVERKEISPDEAYMKSVEKAGLQASLKAKGHKLTITARAEQSHRSDLNRRPPRSAVPPVERKTLRHKEKRPAQSPAE